MRGSLGEKIGEGAMADVHAGRLATRGRAEQVEMLDAELLQRPYVASTSLWPRRVSSAVPSGAFPASAL